MNILWMVVYLVMSMEKSYANENNEWSSEWFKWTDLKVAIGIWLLDGILGIHDRR